MGNNVVKKTKTQRGFSLGKFEDSYGEECSIQMSSTGEHIWLGLSKLKVSVGYPWVDIGADRIKEAFHAQEIVATTRMHLNRKQVKKLLPLLQKFVEDGDF